MKIKDPASILAKKEAKKLSKSFDDNIKKLCLECIKYYGKDTISMEEMCAFMCVTMNRPTYFFTPMYGERLINNKNTHYVDFNKPITI